MSKEDVEKMVALQKEVAHLRIANLAFQSLADIETMTDEADEVLAAKTPMEEPVLWQETDDMLSLLGIEKDGMEKVNLMPQPDAASAAASNERERTLKVRRSRMQYLHLQEHVKLRTILDSYTQLLEMMSTAGITDKKSRDALLADLVKVNPTKPGDVVEHFKEALENLQKNLPQDIPEGPEENPFKGKMDSLLTVGM
jgi:hypothetical protein